MAFHFIPELEEMRTTSQTDLLQQYEIFSDQRSMKKVAKAFQGSSLRIKITQQNSITDVQQSYSSSSSAPHSPPLSRESSTGSSPGDDSSPDEATATTKTNMSAIAAGSGMCVSPEVRNRRNIIYMQSRIKNLKDKTFIAPDRLFIREAIFLKDKLFFLFNDLLVITKLIQKTNESSSNNGAEKGGEGSDGASDYYFSAETANNNSSIRGSGGYNCSSSTRSTPNFTQVKFRRSLDIMYLTVKALPDVSKEPKGQNLLQLKYNKKENGKRNKFTKIYAAPTKTQRDAWFIEICSLRDKLEASSSPPSSFALDSTVPPLSSS